MKVVLKRVCHSYDTRYDRLLMELIHFLHPEAKTTRDGHAQLAVSDAFNEIVNAMHDPSKRSRSDVSPLAAFLVENLVSRFNEDILQAAASMKGYGDGDREAYQPDEFPKDPVFIWALEESDIRD